MGKNIQAKYAPGFNPKHPIAIEIEINTMRLSIDEARELVRRLTGALAFADDDARREEQRLARIAAMPSFDNGSQ